MATFTIPKSQGQDISALKEVWQTIHYDSCPYQYNFHLHTISSDGRMTPDGLVKQAIALGLLGLAITDHHSIEGWEVAQIYLTNLAQQQPNLTLPHLWIGVEITAYIREIEVHILGYGFDPDHQSMQPYLRGSRPRGRESYSRKVIAAIHEAGGLAILAHPSRYRAKAEDLIPEAVARGIDGVEAYYGYSHPKPWLPSTQQTEKALKLAKQYNLYTTCGTDSHGLTILETI